VRAGAGGDRTVVAEADDDECGPMAAEEVAEQLSHHPDPMFACRRERPLVLIGTNTEDLQHQPYLQGFLPPDTR